MDTNLGNDEGKALLLDNRSKKDQFKGL